MDVDMANRGSQRMHGPGPIKATATINWGTMTLAVSIEVEGKEARGLSLMSGCPDTPQQAAWDLHGNFYWGHGIKRALRRGLIVQGDVIEFFKLCLYDDFAFERIPLLVRQQCADKGKTIQDLISEHLAAIHQAIRDSLKGDSTYGLMPTQVRVEPLHL